MWECSLKVLHATGGFGSKAVVHERLLLAETCRFAHVFPGSFRYGGSLTAATVRDRLLRRHHVIQRPIHR